MTGNDIDAYMTISQITFESWKQRFDKTKREIESPKTHKAWKFIRKAVIAGRSQVWKKGHFKGEFHCKDVKSLYPFTMQCQLFPIRQEIETDCFVEGKMGVYNCDISNQPEDNIIPKRSEKNPLDWKYRGDINCNLCTVDIDCLKRHGSNVKIHNGYYWEESKDIFSKYISIARIEKTKQDELKYVKDPDYNAALRGVCKLLMNSLSGKVIQRIFLTDTRLVTTSKEIELFCSTHDNITIEPLERTDAIFLKGEKTKYRYKSYSVKPCHLGVFIYAYSRAHMYDSVISKIKNKYAMDTDSIHISNVNVEKLIHHIPKEKLTEIGKEKYGIYTEGNQFGNFEEEIDFKTRDVYYVAPKCYGFFSDDITKKGKKCVKMRFKGVGKRDKLLTMIKPKFDKLTTKKKFELYNGLKPALCEELYPIHLRLVALAGVTVSV